MLELFCAYEKKVTNNCALLAEDCDDDPFSFAANRILSFPALVDKDSYLRTGVLSGNELESELDMAHLNAGVGSTVPGDDNYLELEMRLDSGINDLDYSWME